MKVLVTGAGGNLARVAVPALAAAGHTLRLLDFRPIDTAHDLLQGDLRNPDDLARAVDDVDAVVHAAALHGIHRGHWSPRDFWAINVDGTFNLYQRRLPLRSPRWCWLAAWPSTAEACSRHRMPGRGHRGQPDPAR
jgi:nucleoside-diphosphate-sugar epimerase